MRSRFAITVVCAAAVLVATQAVFAATCTPTGFYRDGINMTAAVINPSSVTGTTVDATGCNVGVYIDSGKAVVQFSEIKGANYFGVLVNGDVNIVKVDVVNSNIHDIGEVPLNGTQHGVAIYYRALGSGSVKGRIADNKIYNYQKGGIVANGSGATVNISENEVTGQGAVFYIAQNGIQVGYGASAQVMDNTVTGNSYSGSNNAASGGILIVGGPGYGGAFTVGTQIVGNVLTGNDVGVYISNYEADYTAPATATNIKAVNNTITYDSINNTSGAGYPCGYQAGVSDVGNNDKIINNSTSGTGYDASASPSGCPYLIAIDADASFTNLPKVHANQFTP